ncbi:MAG: zinc-ribbon domain-containing protein [Blautia sp.]
MFCEKCEEKIDSNMKFCPKCGMPVPVAPENTKTAWKIPKSEKLKMPVIFGIVAIVAVILVMALTGSSPEKVALKSCKANLKGNVKAYYKLLAPPYQEYMVGPHQWFPNEEEFQDTLMESSEELQRNIRRECGEKYKVDVEVKNTEKCDKDELRAVRKELKGYYDYDSDKIKAAAVVTVNIDASGNEGIGYWTYEV